MVPGYITFRPDNMLTVGLMGLIMYLAALFGVQVLGRWGVVKLAAPAVKPASTRVAT
jgi:hypothetical protein